MTTLMWFRRDLRTRDHPALSAAATAAVLPCFVLDPTTISELGPVRLGWLAANLQALNADLDGKLCLRLGDPAEVIPRLAAEYGITAVHVSAESEPEGAHRDAQLREALRVQGVRWVATGSPYAVSPGRLHTQHGSGYRVFGAYRQAWLHHGWPHPAPAMINLRLVSTPAESSAWDWLLAAAAQCPIPLPPAGQQAADVRWQEFLRDRRADYATNRDRVDLGGTSLLSPYLALGVMHPRTLLAAIGELGDADSDRFRTELAWREFYADVTWHRPDSLRADLNPLPVAYDPPGDRFAAWQAGRTGYPIVDAGQRQLAATGQLPNRVRMISASFLTKDLHIWWRYGADHFARRLLDFDEASNVQNWQWVAGTGTDAAPYFRIFNPTTQAERFDPDGVYVRRWVPELSHLTGKQVHQPWAAAAGYSQGYSQRIVDHATERLEALARYQHARQGD